MTILILMKFMDASQYKIASESEYLYFFYFLLYSGIQPKGIHEIHSIIDTLHKYAKAGVNVRPVGYFVHSYN